MDVAVDGLRLSGQRLGVGRYIEYLLQNWSAAAPSSDAFTVYAPHTPPDAAQLTSSRVTIETLPSRLPGYAWQSTRLARSARSADVLFGPSYRLPWRYRGAAVVAIHSANEVEPGAHGGAYRLTQGAIIRASAHRAQRVIVPLQSTARDVAAEYEVPAEKLVVIPQGADAAFRPIDDVELLRATRRKFLGDPDRPYVLWVGKLSRRRNVPVLLEAFAELRQRYKLPHHLLLFGPNHLGFPIEETAERLGVADAVIQTDGMVTDHQELVAIYNAADLYVNASSYEGFSMTLIEALACGVPVVGVNRAAVGEIAKDCALLVEEPTVGALVDAMHRGLTDATLRQDLRAKGILRARDYQWDDVAQRTLDVLREVAVGG